MSLDKLKTRARNLQRAMQAMLQQPIKLSQAYELIANEEGFANWDTACAMLQPAKPEKDDSSLTGVSLYTNSHPDEFSLNGMIPGDQRWLTLIDAIPSKPVMLTVITGPTGSGKSSLANAIITRRTRALSVLRKGPPTPADELDFAKLVKSALRQSPHIMYTGETRTLEHVKSVVEIWKTGTSVITTLQGDEKQPLHEMLKKAVPGVETLDEYDSFKNQKGMEYFHLHLDKSSLQ